MPDWCGIEDGSAIVEPVWVCCETKEGAEWQPLRKVDCKALNQSPDKPILIDGHRAIADPSKGTIRYHFHRRRPILQLQSATWFVKDDDRGGSSGGEHSSEKSKLTPMTQNDAMKCEELYQKAIYETSSFGNGIESILQLDEILLQQEQQDDTSTAGAAGSPGATFTTTEGKDINTPIEVDDKDDDDDDDVMVVEVDDKESTVVVPPPIQPPTKDNNSNKRKTTTTTSWSIRIVKIDGGKLIMRKCQTGWFGKSYDLQRGYGAYTVDGEVEEELMGPVKQLIFVIHGVGESLLSREDVRMESFVDQMTRTRLSIQKRQVEEWKRNCETAKQQKKPEPAPPTRIELIPIEWYDRLHGSSNEIMMSLQATTLNSIPALRAIANDVVFDVLMYLTPSFCAEVLECVTEQINEMYTLFQKCHPNFLETGGKASLIGHSLGSVICWDLLSIMKDLKRKEQQQQQQQQQQHDNNASSDSLASLMALQSTGVPIVGKDGDSNGQAPEVGYQHYAREEHANKAKNGSWGPSLPAPMKKCLPFVPAFTMFVGSPIGLFLTLRGAHAVFDEVRRVTNLRRSKEAADSPDGTVDVEVAYEVLVEESLLHPVSPFTLPSGSIHNIFHPSDPVAYRIEPLLLPQGTPLDALPPPLYLTRVGGDVRFHVKARQFGDEIKKSLYGGKSALSLFASKVTSVVQKLDESNEKNRGSSSNKFPTTIRQEGLTFPLAGTRQRVDYQLQPRVIDNEYLAAVTAHSTYFDNTDVLDYIIDLAAPPPPTPQPSVTSDAGATTETTTTSESKEDNDNSRKESDNVPKSSTNTEETPSSLPSSESKWTSFW